MFKLPFSKQEEASSEKNGANYVCSGSPRYRLNPLNLEAKPLTFQLTDVDGRIINDQWLEDKWLSHTGAGPTNADALDKIIVSAGALQAASLREQVWGEDGSMSVIASAESEAPEYYQGLCRNTEESLMNLEQIIARINKAM